MKLYLKNFGSKSHARRVVTGDSAYSSHDTGCLYVMDPVGSCS